MTCLNTNIKIKGATQFENYEFNSFCNFNGVQLAASDRGISLLGGNNDEGAAISVYFEPVTSDLGSPRPKHVRFLYFGFEADGALRVVVGDDAGRMLAYPITPRADGQQRFRVTVSRALQGRYFTFRVENIQGADFSIDSIDCLYVSRSHGQSQDA